MAAVESHELGREIDWVALEFRLTALARHQDFRQSANMSARSVGYARWTRTLNKGLDLGPTLGERLIREITEYSGITVLELVISFMDDLQSRGVAFALEHFGADNTAIRYFKDLLFDILKIDVQFISKIDRAVVKVMLANGRHFDMFRSG